jgi:hypothetical protein
VNVFGILGVMQLARLPEITAGVGVVPSTFRNNLQNVTNAAAVILRGDMLFKLAIEDAVMRENQYWKNNIGKY